MKVIATAPGFFGSRRRKGDLFDVPAGTTAKWFAPVASVAPAAPRTAPVAKPSKGKGAEGLV